MPASEDNHEACGSGVVGTHSALVLNAFNQANKSEPHLIERGACSV